MVEHLVADGEEPCVTLDAFLSQSNATAVRLEPDEDARALIPHLDRLALIEVAFPKFRDGRGYSSARILREAGYTGELRAQGDVLVDQIGYLKRCGFDSFAPEKPLNSYAQGIIRLRKRSFRAAIFSGVSGSVTSKSLKNPFSVIS